MVDRQIFEKAANLWAYSSFMYELNGCFTDRNIEQRQFKAGVIEGKLIGVIIERMFVNQFNFLSLRL